MYQRQMLQECSICFREENSFVFEVLCDQHKNCSHALQLPGPAESHHMVFFSNEILIQFRVDLTFRSVYMTPIYTAELAPASSHGCPVSLPEIFIHFGILLGYIVIFCVSGLPAYLSWCLMLGTCSVQALCMRFVLDFEFC